MGYQAGRPAGRRGATTKQDPMPQRMSFKQRRDMMKEQQSKGDTPVKNKNITAKINTNRGAATVSYKERRNSKRLAGDKADQELTNEKLSA